MINDKVTELYNKSPKNFHKSFIENNNVLSRNKKGRRIIKIFRWIFNDTKLQNNYNICRNRYFMRFFSENFLRGQDVVFQGIRPVAQNFLCYRA